MLNIHASCVKLENQGVLIFGPSGAGKSDLCLRLIIEHQGVLVADDRTEIVLKKQRLYASAPDSIFGRLEVRGVGIADLPAEKDVPLFLAVQIVDNSQEIERLPKAQTYKVNGGEIPLIKIHSQEASAPAKIIMALRMNGNCYEKEEAC